MKAKCDTSKCKAACCYNVPMPKGFFSAYRKKIVTPYKRLIEQQACDDNGKLLYLPIVSEKWSENKCPFLRDDYKCNIYEVRPWICRNFGTPPEGNKSKLLHCGWLEGKECDNAIENKGDHEDALADIMHMVLTGKIKV